MKNWKTTLAGLITGLPIAGDALLKAYVAGQFTGESGVQLLASIGIILFGLVSKDHNVTGGSTPQTTEAIERTDK